MRAEKSLEMEERRKAREAAREGKVFVKTIKPKAAPAPAPAAASGGGGGGKEKRPVGRPPKNKESNKGGGAASSSGSSSKALPDGWSEVRHDAKAGPYKSFHGPNGERARSKSEAWRLASISKEGNEEEAAETEPEEDDDDDVVEVECEVVPPAAAAAGGAAGKKRKQPDSGLEGMAGYKILPPAPAAKEEEGTATKGETR